MFLFFSRQNYEFFTKNYKEFCIFLKKTSKKNSQILFYFQYIFLLNFVIPFCHHEKLDSSSPSLAQIPLLLTVSPCVINVQIDAGDLSILII